MHGHAWRAYIQVIQRSFKHSCIQTLCQRLSNYIMMLNLVRYNGSSMWTSSSSDWMRSALRFAVVQCVFACMCLDLCIPVSCMCLSQDSCSCSCFGTKTWACGGWTLWKHKAIGIELEVHLSIVIQTVWHVGMKSQEETRETHTVEASTLPLDILFGIAMHDWGCVCMLSLSRLTLEMYT